MDYRRPERVEPLAAQYVLGTLRGRARVRFARLVQTDRGVAASVQAWEARFELRRGLNRWPRSQVTS